VQHHAERMARLQQLIDQLDQMHRQVAEIAGEVAQLQRERELAAPIAAPTPKARRSRPDRPPAKKRKLRR
jgi:hypothetical protein